MFLAIATFDIWTILHVHLKCQRFFASFPFLCAFQVCIVTLEIILEFGFPIDI